MSLAIRGKNEISLLTYNHRGEVIMPNADKDSEKLDLSYIADGNGNGTVTLEKLNILLLHIYMRSSNYSPTHLLQRNENLCLHKNLNTNVCVWFVVTCNNQNVFCLMKG